MGTAIKHPVPNRVKPSFVIFDIRALRRSGLSVRVPGCQKLQIIVWHTMLYSRAQMATVGVKGSKPIHMVVRTYGRVRVCKIRPYTYMYVRTAGSGDFRKRRVMFSYYYHFLPSPLSCFLPSLSLPLPLAYCPG